MTQQTQQKSPASPSPHPGGIGPAELHAFADQYGTVLPNMTRHTKKPLIHDAETFKAAWRGWLAGGTFGAWSALDVDWLPVITPVGRDIWAWTALVKRRRYSGVTAKVLFPADVKAVAESTVTPGDEGSPEHQRLFEELRAWLTLPRMTRERRELEAVLDELSAEGDVSPLREILQAYDRLRLPDA